MYNLGQGVFMQTMEQFFRKHQVLVISNLMMNQTRVSGSKPGTYRSVERTFRSWGFSLRPANGRDETVILKDLDRGGHALHFDADRRSTKKEGRKVLLGHVRGIIVTVRSREGHDRKIEVPKNLR